MTKTQRVRIIHDSNSEDPRDWDSPSIIKDTSRSGIIDMKISLIIQTDGWAAAQKMLSAANGDHEPLSYYDYDPEDLSPEEVDSWIERLGDELIVEDFWIGDYHYLAWITPTLCAHTGTPWDRARVAMEADIETFTQWANNDVYGFIIEEWNPACGCDSCEAGEYIEVESCWGFYGSDPRLNGMADHMTPEQLDMAVKAEVEY